MPGAVIFLEAVVGQEVPGGQVDEAWRMDGELVGFDSTDFWGYVLLFVSSLSFVLESSDVLIVGIVTSRFWLFCVSCC